MYYSVCIDNQELRQISPFSVDWNTPFLNLFFHREKAQEKLFADNGKHWQYSDTDDSFKTVILDVYLDDQDHIENVTMYKYQATSFNHGKNSSKELKVSSADRKKFLAILQEVVSDPSEKELERLLSAIQQNSFGNERQFFIKKNDISLLDRDGKRQTIKIKTLLWTIQVSHTYIEVLQNVQLLAEYTNDITPANGPVLQEILSFVDTEQYYRINDLRYEMEIRNLIHTAEEKYPLLRQAVINGNLEDVQRLSAYAKLVPQENPEGSPLYHAVQENRLDIAKVLLENGAYAIEMGKNGIQYPLEVAYQNGYRDMVRLLLAYHGAKSRGYSVTKYNTDNVLRACAANKDYEVLELMAPDAYTIDTRTWLTPDMFPDMNNDTIMAISKCKGIRMAWDLEQISPFYEKKDFEMCKKMLQQGSTGRVVAFFIAQDDFELFEASVQHHVNLKEYVGFGLAYERGGKWCETLSKHFRNLYQTVDIYFRQMLNNDEIDHYLQVMEKREGPFLGIGGYIVWPEKIKEPDKYVHLVKVFIQKNQPCRERNLFLEDIIRFFGDEVLAKEYYEKYPLAADIEWRSYLSNTIVSKYIRDDATKNPYAGAEMIRSFFSQEMDNKDKKVYELFTELVIGCNLWKPLDAVTDEQKLYGKERRSQYMLHALLDCVSIKKLDEIVMQNDRSGEVKSAYQYAVRYGKNIRNTNFLSMLKESQ